MPSKQLSPTPPFKSKLRPVEHEIMRAWYQRQTLRDIQSMLADKHGIIIGEPAISKFISRRKSELTPEVIFAGTTAKENTTKDKAARIKAMLDEELSKNPDDLIREQALKEWKK